MLKHDIHKQLVNTVAVAKRKSKAFLHISVMKINNINNYKFVKVCVGVHR